MNIIDNIINIIDFNHEFIIIFEYHWYVIDIIGIIYEFNWFYYQYCWWIINGYYYNKWLYSN